MDEALRKRIEAWRAGQTRRMPETHALMLDIIAALEAADTVVGAVLEGQDIPHWRTNALVVADAQEDAGMQEWARWLRAIAAALRALERAEGKGGAR